jgi:hypothetical protein
VAITAGTSITAFCFCRPSDALRIFACADKKAGERKLMSALQALAVAAILFGLGMIERRLRELRDELRRRP